MIFYSSSYYNSSESLFSDYENNVKIPLLFTILETVQPESYTVSMDNFRYLCLSVVMLHPFIYILANSRKLLSLASFSIYNYLSNSK